MPSKAVSAPTHPGWAVDWHSLDRNSGRQIDWAQSWPTDANGRKYVASGTPVAQDGTSGKLVPRVVTTFPATGLVEGDAHQDDRSGALSGVGVIIGGAIYGNLLPVLAANLAAIITELKASGTGWYFETYEDSTT